MRTDKLIEKWCEVWNTKVSPKASWFEREKRYRKLYRLEYLITLSYFLSLRQKIKTEVQQNYNNLNYTYNIIEYDEYGFFEIDCVNSHKLILQPLIDEYIKKVTTEIENNTLKLAL